MEEDHVNSEQEEGLPQAKDRGIWKDQSCQYLFSDIWPPKWSENCVAWAIHLCDFDMVALTDKH